MVKRFARFGSRFGARMGVRARSALVAVVVVSAALLLGGTGLVYVLQTNLENTAETVARDRASEVVAVIREDGVAETADGLIEESRSGQLVQILRADGKVVGYSNRLIASLPMSPQRPPVGAYSTAEVETNFLGTGGDWKVVSTAVNSRSATYVVQVAVPINVQHETVQTVTVFLLGATPLLVAGVGLAVWLLVGRALRSVERIRSAVAGIDAQRLAARVEVPPTHDEIAVLAETMNVMLDRLQVSHRAQRAFVSDAGHELRSPLATLSTAAELAVDADESTRTRLLATINLELIRMRGLVESLMILARADANDLAVVRTDVDLDDLIDNEVHRLHDTGGKRAEAIIEPVRVWADQQRVAQALRNLVDNAERHARTTVRMTLQSEDDQAVIWVDNDGPVIDDADRQRIFERFVRLDDSRSRDAGGSGLGLAIARTGLQACGGDVSVVDTPDGWCRFEMRIPIPGPAAASPRSAPAQASSGKLQTCR